MDTLEADHSYFYSQTVVSLGLTPIVRVAKEDYTRRYLGIYQPNTTATTWLFMGGAPPIVGGIPVGIIVGNATVQEPFERWFDRHGPMVCQEWWVNVQNPPVNNALALVLEVFDRGAVVNGKGGFFLGRAADIYPDSQGFNPETRSQYVGRLLREASGRFRP